MLNIKMSAKGGPVFTFSLPGGQLVFLLPVRYATVSEHWAKLIKSTAGPRYIRDCCLTLGRRYGFRPDA